MSLNFASVRAIIQGTRHYQEEVTSNVLTRFTKDLLLTSYGQCLQAARRDPNSVETEDVAQALVEIKSILRRDTYRVRNMPKLSESPKLNRVGFKKRTLR